MSKRRIRHCLQAAELLGCIEWTPGRSAHG
jgi:hypothetical protein